MTVIREFVRLPERGFRAFGSERKNGLIFVTGGAVFAAVPLAVAVLRGQLAQMWPLLAFGGSFVLIGAALAVGRHDVVVRSGRLRWTRRSVVGTRVHETSTDNVHGLRFSLQSGDGNSWFATNLEIDDPNFPPLFTIARERSEMPLRSKSESLAEHLGIAFIDDLADVALPATMPTQPPSKRIEQVSPDHLRLLSTIPPSLAVLGWCLVAVALGLVSVGTINLSDTFEWWLSALVTAPLWLGALYIATWIAVSRTASEHIRVGPEKVSRYFEWHGVRWKRRILPIDGIQEVRAIAQGPARGITVLGSTDTLSCAGSLDRNDLAFASEWVRVAVARRSVGSVDS